VNFDPNLIEQLPDGIFTLDESGNYTYVNNAAAQYVNREPTDLMGKNVWEEFPEDRSGEFFSAFNKVIRTGEIVRYRQYYSKSDRWFSFNVYAHEGGVLVWYKDDTDRSRREDENIQANKIILDAIESFKDLAILSVDRLYRYIFFNNSHLDFSHKAFNRTPKLGEPFFAGAILNDPSFALIQKELNRAFEGQARNFVLPFRFPWGVEYIDIHLRPNKPVNGVVQAISMFAWNDTQRILGDRELERTREIINQTNAVAFTWSNVDDLHIAFVTKNVKSLLGYEREELLAGKKRFSEMVLAEDLSILSNAVSEQKSNNTQRSKPFRMVTKEGGVKWVEMLWFNTFNSDGSLREVNSLLFDMDQIMLLQEKVNESEQRMNSALRGADLGVWDFNIKKNTNIVNARWWNMLGYEVGEIEDSLQFFFDATHPEDRDKPFERIAEIENGDKNEINMVIRMKHKNGGYRYILDRGSVVAFDKAGKALRVIGTHMDVTAEETLLQHLRDQKKKWREVARSQSYEIRAPLARIMGLLNLIDDENIEAEELKKMCKNLHDSARELDEHIHSIAAKVNTLELDEDLFN